MKGFFSDPKLAGSGKKAVKKHPCEKCLLYKKANTPRMPVTGKGEKGIWVHGEGPGAEEDKHGKQFHEKGAAGNLLRRLLRAYDIDLDEDCYKDNSIRCRAPNNRTPTDTEIKLCQTWIIPDIIDKSPQKILLFGGAAIKSLITTRLPGLKFDGVKKWVGWQIPDQQLKAWLFPNWHTSFLNRNSKDRALWLKFNSFLETMVDWNQPFPDYENYQDHIDIITSSDEASSLLTRLIQEKRPGALDWETTGLKPHAEGHRIVAGGICVGREEAYAFPIFDDRRFQARLKRWLRDPEIEKYVHSQRMESSWSLNYLNTELNGVTWDCMEVAHVLDNRPGITSLKTQVYLRYGIVYGREMKRYLEPAPADAKKYGANAFNRIDEASMDKLLLYQGSDALFTYWLAKDQIQQLRPMNNGGWAYVPSMFMLGGSSSLAKVHESGIPINRKYCREQNDRLSLRLDKVKGNLDESEEMEKWLEATNKPLNPDSDPQLNKLFHKILKYKPLKETARGNPSVDKEVLTNIGTPFAQNVIRFRHLNKLKNTYLGGFSRESVNGVIRPFFPTHLVSTYRGSSSDPNFQNIPMRDAQAQKITRKAIRARPGRQILDVDYAGIEVRVGACNSHDPKLIEYVSDPSTDMHRDLAIQIYLLDNEEDGWRFKFAGKNQFVFPQFYGSWYGNCAPNLWRTAQEGTLQNGTPLIEHLREKGFKTYNQFEDHVREVEDDFWNVRFAVYRDWKDDMWEFYQKHGYIELLTGFRCYWSPSGLLTPKECMNYPNQGPAFHCLLWSIKTLSDTIAREKNFESRIIGQIHDDVVWEIAPEEKEELYPIIRKIMCEEIREKWNWLIVPLDIEGKITEVGGNWYEQRDEEI